MNKAKGGLLKEWQQKLLQRYADGECCPLLRFLAGGLIKRRPEAGAYVARLRELGETTRRWYDMQVYAEKRPRAAAESLWARVDRRIVQEERSGLYLGRREFTREKRRWYVSLGWGFSGAALAAACAAVVVMQFDGRSKAAAPEGLYAKSAMMDNFAPQIQPVAERQAVYPRPQPLYERHPNEVEMDWLRSTGRVSLIHDNGQRLPIIWVKRRQPETGADVPLANNHNNIRILSDNVPTALTVGSK